MRKPSFRLFFSWQRIKKPRKAWAQSRTCALPYRAYFINICVICEICVRLLVLLPALNLQLILAHCAECLDEGGS